MKKDKLKQLKKQVKLTTLAEQAGTSIYYLSHILNNRDRCSAELATKLALIANKLTFTFDYKPEDFRNDDQLQRQQTAD